MKLQEEIIRIKEVMGVLTEETVGADDFISNMVSKYPQSKNCVDIIRSFIDKSNCKKIEIAPFKYPALGLALHNGVLFNIQIFSLPLPDFLFVFFHEMSHQYQYKKYGDDKMYQFYVGEISVEDAAKIMQKVELTADELAIRKIRELIKLGYIDKLPSPMVASVYKKIPLSHFEKLILTCRNDLKANNKKEFDDIADYFYNTVKVNR